MKPERQEARNAKGGENISSGGNSMSKGTKVGKELLFSSTGRLARVEKPAKEYEMLNQ